MTIQKDMTASKQGRSRKIHEEMTEKDVICATLYVTVSDEQLEREKIKRSEKQREMTPEEFEDFREGCAEAVAEATEHARLRKVDYVGETIKSMQKARDRAIERNEIVEGDEVQLNQKIRGYRGQDIVPLPDWVFAEGMYGRVEKLFHGKTVRPGWWKEPDSAKSQPSPPHALVVYPDLYLGFYNWETSRVEFQYIGDYDCVNKDGEVVHCNTIEECENPELAGFARDEESVLINGVVHTVLQEERCEVSIPTHWLEQRPGNQRRDF